VTNPLMRLEVLSIENVTGKPVKQSGISIERAQLRDELAEIYTTLYSALEHRDLHSFLSVTCLSK